MEKIQYADQLVEKLEVSGTGQSKIQDFKKEILDYFKREGKRMVIDLFLKFLENYFNLPKYEKEKSPFFVTYKKACDIVNFGEVKPFEEKDEYKELIQIFQENKK